MDYERASERLPLRRRLPAARRIRRPREFAAIIGAPAAVAWTARGSWWAMKAVWRPLDTAHTEANLRLGITIAKRWAARAVDRSRLKRIARESFRHAAPSLDAAAERAGIAVDLSLRLIASIPSTLSAAAFASAARAESDRLVVQLLARIDGAAQRV